MSSLSCVSCCDQVGEAGLLHQSLRLWQTSLNSFHRSPQHVGLRFRSGVRDKRPHLGPKSNPHAPLGACLATKAVLFSNHGTSLFSGGIWGPEQRNGLPKLKQWFCGRAGASTEISWLTTPQFPSIVSIGKYNTLLMLNSRLLLPAFPPIVFQGHILIPVVYSIITGVSVSTLNLLLLVQVETNSKPELKAASQLERPHKKTICWTVMNRAQQHSLRIHWNINWNHPPCIRRSKFNSNTLLLLAKGITTHRHTLFLVTLL